MFIFIVELLMNEDLYFCDSSGPPINVFVCVTLDKTTETKCFV